MDILGRQDGAAAGEAVFMLRGHVDLSTAADVQADLEWFIERCTNDAAVIDCSALESIDSTGIKVLVIAHRYAYSDGVRLTLRGLRPLHRELIEMVGLGRMLTIDA